LFRELAADRLELSTMATPRRTLITAVIVLWVVSRLIPFGGVIVYPLTLLTTWVHEMGHGLAALLVGGRFSALEIYSDASGLAHASAAHGWREAIVCAGGLLAPPILGTIILGFVHGARRARVLLFALAGALALSVGIWVRSLTGLIVMPLCAALLGWAAWRGFAKNVERRVLLAQILGVVLALDTVTRMVSYVFTREVEVNGKTSPSDIAMIAENAGGHYLLWGILFTVFACGLIALGALRAWRASKPRTAEVRRRA
jgi:hypothetical protein